MIDIYWNWNKNMEMKWVSLLSVDPGYPFLLKKNHRSIECSLCPSMVIVGTLAGIKGYLYQFILLIKCFVQFLVRYKVYPCPRHLVQMN